jgi:hypothetical protein
MLTINDKPARWLKSSERIREGDFIYCAQVSVTLADGCEPSEELKEHMRQKLRQTRASFHPVNRRHIGLRVRETAHGLCAAASIARYK